MPTRDVEKRPFLEKRPSFKSDIERCTELLGDAVKGKCVI